MGEVEPLLEVVGLRKIFETRAGLRTKRIHAVSDVSFSMHKGQVTAIVGESGSGKSTVARLISRLIEPTDGTMQFDGKSYGHKIGKKERIRLRSEVQMVFQDPFGSLNPSKTIGYHLMRPLLNYKKCRGNKEAVRRALETLESVGLTPASDYMDKYPHELSGGQLQRVVLGRAMIVEPKLILADEPTSMLDVSIRMGVLNLMKGLQQSRGLALLFITHDLASARYLSDHLFVMYAGEMVEGGSADEVVSNPQHPYTRLLLSAVPDVEKNSLLDEETAQGEPPDLSVPPKGCRFYPRCPLAMDICTHQSPTRILTQSNHWATCHALKSGGES